MSENQLPFTKIWLVGLSGSGKSTVGNLLASRLNVPFFDTDVMIESSEKLKVSEIFEQKGEVYFRLKEKELCDALITTGNSLEIISTGGGFPCFNLNLSKMKESGLVIFLNCSTEILTKRLSNTLDRPLLKDDLQEKLNEQLHSRKSIYEQADISIDASENTDEVLNKISDCLEALKSDDVIDYNSEQVTAFLSTFKLESTVKETAISLYLKVRDGFIYDPYHLDISPSGLKASNVVTKKRAWCVEKALLLATCARSLKIPTKLGFAIVTNHIGTEKLTKYLNRKEIVFHGYASLYINGKWVKCTPAFDKRVCAITKVEPLEWNGEEDSLFQEYSQQGQQFMEYLHYYGEFTEIPFELMKKEMQVYYPHLFSEKYNSKEFSFVY